MSTRSATSPTRLYSSGFQVAEPREPSAEPPRDLSRFPPPGKAETRHALDTWDMEMLKALGFDSDEASTSLPLPTMTAEEAQLMREARFHVRSHMAKVIKALVGEMDRMYRARFGADSIPVSWKMIRKAVSDTRMDLGKEDIAKAEAGRLFLRNTLRKKLAALDIQEDIFFRAVDVTSPEWKGQTRRGEVCLTDDECFVPFSSVSELLARLDEIVLPAELQASFNESKVVIARSEPVVLKDAERALDRLSSVHLAGEGAGRKRYKQRVVYKPERGGGGSKAGAREPGRL